MAVSKEKVISDLKVLRRLAELLPLIGNTSEFAWHHVVEIIDGAWDESCDIPFFFDAIDDDYDGGYRNDSRAYNKLCNTCVFVAPKKKDEFKRLSLELMVYRLLPAKDPARYKRYVLPTILQMIDIALKEEK